MLMKLFLDSVFLMLYLTNMAKVALLCHKLTDPLLSNYTHINSHGRNLLKDFTYHSQFQMRSHHFGQIFFENKDIRFERFQFTFNINCIHNCKYVTSAGSFSLFGDLLNHFYILCVRNIQKFDLFSTAAPHTLRSFVLKCHKRSIHRMNTCMFHCILFLSLLKCANRISQ